MAKKNQYGKISLIISISGLIIVQSCLYLGIISGRVWHVILAGFEAATVGGFADWFAVSALFREIPIPLLRRHTNIIVKSRNNITESIVDLVTNEWLSPKVIAEKIKNLSIAKTIIETLREPYYNRRLMFFIKDIINRLIRNVDVKEVSSLINNKLNEVDFAEPISKWLIGFINEDKHYWVWNKILNAAQNAINDKGIQAKIYEIIEDQVEEYKRGSKIRNIFLSGAELFGAIDTSAIAQNFIESINKTISDAKTNPNHPIRVKYDTELMEFVIGIKEKNKKQLDTIENIKKLILDNTDINVYINDFISNLKNNITNQVRDDNSVLLVFIKTKIDEFLNETIDDQKTINKIDVWLRNTISDMVEKYHHEIGEMVRFSLSKLDDVALVAQIEDKVGNDLQFIRLNGAVVGGTIGIIIACVKIIIGVM